MPAIYHVSEDPGIEVFEPRYSELIGSAAVWAVDEEHLCNYLLPRDCPRVCYRSGPNTSPEDISRFFPDPSKKAAIAIENAWLPQAQTVRLYLYELPQMSFRLADAVAGYYVSSEVVVPSGNRSVESPLDVLSERSVELRLLDSPWELRDRVVESTMDYSIIRMRNAKPRCR